MLTDQQKATVRKRVKEMVEQGHNKSTVLNTTRLAYVAWGIEDVHAEVKKYYLLET